MGVGGLLGGLANTNAIVQGGGLQGQIQGNEIAFQRQKTLADLMRESQLAQAQIERDKAMGGYYGGLNDARLQIANTNVGGREAVANTNAGARTDAAQIGADSRTGVAQIGADSRGDVATTNAGRAIAVANINAQSRQTAAKIRLSAMVKGPAAGLAFRAINEKGTALLSQYPDDNALNAAETADPSLTAKLNQVDPNTGITLRDSYHVALQGQQRSTTNTLGRMYSTVPSPQKVQADAQTLGIMPRPLAPPVAPLAGIGPQAPQGPPPATLGNTGGLGLTPIDSPNWRSQKGYSMDQLRNMDGGALTPAGPPAPPPPAAIPSPGLPPTAGTNRQPRTLQQMQRTLTTNPDITEAQYRAIYNVLPDPAQGTPNGISSPSQ